MKSQRFWTLTGERGAKDATAKMVCTDASCTKRFASTRTEIGGVVRKVMVDGFCTDDGILPPKDSMVSVFSLSHMIVDSAMTR